MKTTQKEWRGLIEYRIEELRNLTGTNYCTTYCGHYGGWELYVTNAENGGHGRSDFGRTERMTSPEFYYYLEGILAGLRYGRK